jgi:hypothetical protein
MTNQEMLRELLEKADISQAEAAALIAKKTKRPCSVRSVRAWLADASLSSARTCPEWAVQVLKEGLKSHKKLVE